VAHGSGPMGCGLQLGSVGAACLSLLDWGVFGSHFWTNQAHEVPANDVWLPAPLPETGSPDVISLLLPASPETPETAISAEPDSAHAAVSLTNDVLVYN
jgi:hypothetical protein